MDANLAASNLLKREQEEIIGMHQSELHPKELDDRSREMFSEHQDEIESKGKASPTEHKVLQADGNTRIVEIMASMIEVGDERFQLGVFRDITERTEAEREIKRLYQAIETSMNAIATFTAGPAAATASS